jgi:ADP-ribose pyrophosphatase YjhB (NUDIX family)
MLAAMQFCSSCGKTLSLRIPEGDNTMRHVCDSCGAIHYQNPKIVVGCLPVYEGKILLCKRAIDPAYGKWTLPAGFMENGESLEAGATRETREEAEAEVRILRLHSVFSIPHIHQVHFFFLAEILDGRFGAGKETLEAKLVTAEEIPWDEIAFGSVRFALKRYLDAPHQMETHVDSYLKPQ